MRSRTSNVAAWKLVSALLSAGLFCLLGLLLSCGGPQSKQEGAESAQKAFATPEEAVNALIQAAGTYDVPALLEILGPDARDLVLSGDAVGDNRRRVEFASLGKEKQSISLDPNNPDPATV